MFDYSRQPARKSRVSEYDIFDLMSSGLGSRSFGNVALAGLSEEFLLRDLTVTELFLVGGDLGDVDLIYIPEPSTIVLGALASVGLLVISWRRPR